jgi:tryptophan-rich hypothetical protein
MQSKHRHFSKKLFLINSNWTSTSNLAGWKHYRIAARRRADNGKLELEMMAVCDRNVRLWVSRASLRDPACWKPGWLD